MDLIEKPIFDLNTKEICLLFKTVVFIIFKSLKKKVGAGFPLPNGSIFFISLKKFLLNAIDEISAS